MKNKIVKNRRQLTNVIRKNKKTPHKTFTKHKDQKQSNTGKWTAAEQQEFNRLFALYKENKITKSQLFLSIKTRTRRQVNSHLFKIKYYLDKKFKSQEALENKRKLMDQLRHLKPIHMTDESTIQFFDDISQKQINISLHILEKIVCIQKFNSEKSGSLRLPLKIDENILKTIAEEKLFYNMVKSKVDADKQRLADNHHYYSISTKHKQNLENLNESSQMKNMMTKCETSAAGVKNRMQGSNSVKNINKNFEKNDKLNERNNWMNNCNDENQKNFSNFSFKSFSKVLIDNIIQSREKSDAKKKSLNEQISEFFIDYK